MWIDKYKPNNFNNYIGNYKSIRLLNEWYSNYCNGKDSRNVIVVLGNTGIGKTLLVDLFIKKYKFHKTCIYSNTTFSKIKLNLLKHLEFKNILEILQNKKIALVIDDLDIFKEKTYLNELIKLILKNNKKKIVFLISKVFNKTILTNKKILLLELFKPTFCDVKLYINNILDKENYNIEYKQLKYVYEKLSGDVRAIITLIYEMYINNNDIYNNTKYLKKYFNLWKFTGNKTKIIYSKKILDNKLDINSKIKDINYKYNDILDIFINKKVNICDINNILCNSTFVPLTLYDNFNLLKPDFNKYTNCMKDFNYANYFNHNTFQYVYDFNELNLIYMTGKFNYYITQTKLYTYRLKHSILLNNLNKIKTCDNFNTLMYRELLYSNNLLYELNKVFTKIDKKNKNNEKIINYQNFFNNHKIDFNKFIKLFK